MNRVIMLIVGESETPVLERLSLTSGYVNLLIFHFCIYNDHMTVCMIDIEIHSEGLTWKI